MSPLGSFFIPTTLTLSAFLATLSKTSLFNVVYRALRSCVSVILTLISLKAFSSLDGLGDAAVTAAHVLSFAPSSTLAKGCCLEAFFMR